MFAEQLDQTKDTKDLDLLKSMKKTLQDDLELFGISVGDFNEEVLTFYMKKLLCVQGRHFREGRAAFKDSKGWFFIDAQGKPINNKRYVDIEDFKNGKAKVRREKGYYFYIDRDGKQIISSS